MLDKNSCDKIFNEEKKNCGVEDIVSWREGYPIGMSDTYIHKFNDSYRITVPNTLKNYSQFKRRIRHELWHCKLNKGDLLNEFLAYLAEWIPLENVFKYI